MSEIDVESAVREFAIGVGNSAPTAERFYRRRDSMFDRPKKALTEFRNLARLATGEVMTFSHEDAKKLEGCNLLVMMATDNYRKLGFYDNIPDQVGKLAEYIDEPRESIERILRDGTSSHYVHFSIPKPSGGRRQIDAPDEDLMRIQRKILDCVLYRYGVSTKAHGFVVNRSLVTNAAPHVGKSVILKMDIHNFFPSFTGDMVRGGLAPLMRGHESQLFPEPMVELCLKDGVLPQGAPTSPALSNICFAYADFVLTGLAERTECVYTRYADDMVFSSDTFDVRKLIPVVVKLVRRFGLEVSKKKTTVMTDKQRQRVTGVVVNEKLSIPRHKRRVMRAVLHNIATGKADPERVNMGKVEGMMAFFHMVNPEQAERLKPALEQARLKVAGALLHERII